MNAKDIIKIADTLKWTADTVKTAREEFEREMMDKYDGFLDCNVFTKQEKESYDNLTHNERKATSAYSIFINHEWN